MTKQTTRKKLINAIESLVSSRELAEKIADLSISIIGGKDKPAFNVGLADPFWALAHGDEVDQAAIEAEKLKQGALNNFESCLQLKNWEWYPANSVKERAIKVLREFVIETYSKDHLAFQKYQTWRMNPYARGAMSNIRLRSYPEDFPNSFQDFLMQTKNESEDLRRGQGQQNVQTDENDIPLTY